MLLLNRNKTARAALLLGAGLSFATPIWAQNAAFDAAADNAATSPLQAALSSEKTPLTLKASELDMSWRRFKPGAIMGTDLKSVLSDLPDNQSTVSYSFVTHGETLNVGSETFLISYRGGFDFLGLDGQTQFELREMGETSETSDGYARVLPSQRFQLCLLNVRNVGDLGDIRAFDAKTDLLDVAAVTGKAPPTEQTIIERSQLSGDAVNQRVTSDLKQIGLAMAQYLQDYDEKLPSMISAQSMAPIKESVNRNWQDPRSTKVQEVLQPYIKSAEVFAHPTTRELYRPNINVSRRQLGRLEPQSRVITFYEASPAPDGTRAVLYLDGHVKRERETDWAAIRAASDAIAPPFNKSVGFVTTNKASATVTLYDAAAMAYMLRRQCDDKGRPQQVYLSKSTSRIYYRDAQTHQAIFLSSPDGKTARGITIPFEQAQEFREFQGYNGQASGRTYDDVGEDVLSAAIVTPKIKTALGATAALKGSEINVDTTSDNKTVVLRGFTTSQAQKTLAEAIAKKNAPDYRIVNQLVVR